MLVWNMDIVQRHEYKSDYRKIFSYVFGVKMSKQCMSNVFYLKKEKKDNMLIKLDWLRLSHFGFIYGIH